MRGAAAHHHCPCCGRTASSSHGRQQRREPNFTNDGRRHPRFLARSSGSAAAAADSAASLSPAADTPPSGCRCRPPWGCRRHHRQIHHSCRRQCRSSGLGRVASGEEGCRGRLHEMPLLLPASSDVGLLVMRRSSDVSRRREECLSQRRFNHACAEQGGRRKRSGI